MIQKCSKLIVLKEFLDDPLKKFLIRELSRKINLAPTSVKKHLEELIKDKLIIKDKELYPFYIANFDNPDFRFYKKINNLIKIKESKLIDYIENVIQPNNIILFGSASKGEDLKNSDIDIFIQSDTKQINLTKFEKILNKKIQLFVYKDFSKMPKELRLNILNGIKLNGYISI